MEANGRDDTNKRACARRVPRSIDERARHEGGIPGHGRGARHAQVRLRASRRSRAPPPVPSGRDKNRASTRHPPFAVAVRGTPTHDDARRPCSPFPISSSRSPGVAEDELVDNLRELVDRTGRAWCSAPTGGGARARATSARASSRDAASGCSTGPPSTDRRTRSIARRRYSRGWTTTTRGPREETTRASPRPHPTVASPSPAVSAPLDPVTHFVALDDRALIRELCGEALVGRHIMTHASEGTRAADAAAAALGASDSGDSVAHPAVGPGCSAGGDKQRRRAPPRRGRRRATRRFFPRGRRERHRRHSIRGGPSTTAPSRCSTTGCPTNITAPAWARAARNADGR